MPSTVTTYCFLILIVCLSWFLLTVFLILVLCLPQLSQDEATTFYDELNHHIFELVSSSDVNEKKGGILAIGKPLNINMPSFKVYIH